MGNLYVLGIRLRNLYLLIVIEISVAVSCHGETVDDLMQRPYSSLEDERKTWDLWIEAHPESRHWLEPFSLIADDSSYYMKMIEENESKTEEWIELNAENADIFLFLTLLNNNSGMYEITYIGKKADKWILIHSEICCSEDGSIEKFEINSRDVNEWLFRRLSRKRIYLDMPIVAADDASSVYLLLKYRGVYRRFSIFDPPYDAFSRIRKVNSRLPTSTLLMALIRNITRLEKKYIYE